ncbi:Na+/H+ antiporter NhaC [Shouchella shacheensis]|uniref:Na+/H+ antiporter NhaC n=1 Tax=Shouchella shacheensis TaxID=1649580 RepID=UPI00073FDB97|nr:Na+/H+ antiporter NhaC [Shouchella shacheensis]
MEQNQPSFLFASSFFVLFVGVMIVSMFLLQTDPHMPLIVSLVLILGAAKRLGYKWEQLEEGLLTGIQTGIKPMLILMLVGVVIAVWMMSGTVPTLLFYGLQLISPEWFAVSALTVCIFVSTFTGSSFTTIGTIGVAMMGIGAALGVNPALAAGAIICGACFGDKMSPLSDTTNFAPGIVGVELFAHIRHLLWTTVPALAITYLLFLFLGQGGSGDLPNVSAMLSSLEASFTVSALALLSPLLVVVLAAKRYPVLPVLVAGIVTGLLTAMFLQGEYSLGSVFNVMQSGFERETGNELIDEIVQAGGLQSMMWSISLIFIALALGGVAQKIGLIESLFQHLSRFLSKRGHLIASTAAGSISVNLMTGEQYLSILLPGKTFQSYYEKLGLQMKNLSRTLEDAGTLVNPLIPWGVSGAFFAQTLGVPVVDYLPYAFFLFLSPVFTLVYGYTGIGMGREAQN